MPGSSILSEPMVVHHLDLATMRPDDAYFTTPFKLVPKQVQLSQLASARSTANSDTLLLICSCCRQQMRSRNAVHLSSGSTPASQSDSASNIP